MLREALGRLQALLGHLLPGSKSSSSSPKASSLPPAENAASDLPPAENAVSDLPPDEPQKDAALTTSPPRSEVVLDPAVDIEAPPLNLSPRAQTFLERRRNLDRIISGLYIGDIHAAHEKDVLKELGITHILTAVEFCDPAHPQDFEYLYLPLEDVEYEDIQRHFSEAFRFIDSARKAGGKVLVHCFAGISRSSTLACYYISRKFDVPPVPTALGFLRVHRPEVEPNYGFIRQLEDAFERRLRTGRWE
ncbi:protein-tyrosine phosphatase-like protein [Hyaloraphidium curvatum]|nr:protein-tyrosine phosphatase-like protein [Hyaloraphidium curvatum]